MQSTQYTNLTTKKNTNSEYEITATIPADILATYRTRAIQELGASVELPGFRKGHIPQDMLISNLGEARIMERAGNMALSDIYPKILAAENIDAIGSPQIQVKKLADGNPLEFTATTATMPDITLPDYKKIAKKVFEQKEKIEVTEKDLADTLIYFKRQRAHIDAYEKQKADGIENPKIEDVSTIPEKDLPEITDAFVQKLGDFKSVDDFTAKIRENLVEEKEMRATDKKRMQAIEKIIANTTLDLPELIIESELDRMQATMEGEVAQTGTKFEDHLSNIGKTLEALRTEWHTEAEKRAKIQLILTAIAEQEKLNPSEDDVAKEIEHLTTHYPDADPANARVYVTTTKQNEMVFNFLEESGE